MDPRDVFLCVYALCAGLLGLYGAHRLLLLLLMALGKSRPAQSPAAAGSPAVVTVQLPLFNEAAVATRLLRAVGELDWPADKLEIQVLDDSTDATSELVEREVAALVARGLDAKSVRRNTRSGFKAGALAHGLASARGEFVAIFDADFVPPRAFLRETMPQFADPRLGMVQTRWEHLNRDQSWLTRAQAVLLDGHFVIEHRVRFERGLFFNFNGTAGVWRRRTIDDAGGWQHDTLTEDLDLSYRAQLAGWRFAYRVDVCSPAELPAEIGAFKSQQHRWAKGGLQTLRKLGPRILASREPLRVKFEAFMHLSGNAGYPLVLLLALLMPLAPVVLTPFSLLVGVPLFLLSTASVLLFYERSQALAKRSLRLRLQDLLPALALGIGLCVSQTRAVLSGFAREPGAFVRTPKRGDNPRAALYRADPLALPGIELCLAAWFLFGIWQTIAMGFWGTLPFFLLFFAGFTWVGALSLGEALRRRHPQAHRISDPNPVPMGQPLPLLVRDSQPAWPASNAPPATNSGPSRADLVSAHGGAQPARCEP